MLNLFFNNDKKQLKNFNKKISEINLLENEISLLTEYEIKARINKLIKIYKATQNFDIILVESFALTREASKRTLGVRHFDTQLMGGLILHDGKIAEMKTGEGKTLVATLPIVLNALSLKGVHLVTVNDYLAERDKQIMGQLYNYLGLSVGLIQESMNVDERKKNYFADITYVTNNQLAFDYLRDNMVKSFQDIRLRDFNYCIIDEVDSILIDEAQTPLIISGPLKAPIDKYIVADQICKYLKFQTHYFVNEKLKNITLTTRGLKYIENILNVESLYNLNNPWVLFITNAIRANTFFIKNVNYILKDSKIIIVDDLTGRVMADRRWGDGLHEAIEAKENLPIQNGSETLASITYQNFFLSYPKFAGMTGTAKTAEVEFQYIYKRAVLVVPTEKKMIRKDLPDYLFKDAFSKWKALALFVENINNLGRPILIGTTSIEKSEIISSLLIDLEINHQLLNAKSENIKLEAEVIAQAGRKFSVTVATNMAGRGTDILLGGNPDFETRKQIFFFILNLKKKSVRLNKKLYYLLNSIPIRNLTANLILRSFELELFYKKFFRSKKSENTLFEYLRFLKTKNIFNFFKEEDLKTLIVNLKDHKPINKKSIFQSYFIYLYGYFFEKNLDISKREKDVIKILGGLFVIGTERHDSQRIDNQLRGRAGRQGDPGTSKFFLSLDDDLFRIFGANRLKKRLSKYYSEDDSFMESKLFSKSFDRCQKTVEGLQYDSRKNLFDFDASVNFHRFRLYKARNRILANFTMRSEILSYGEEFLTLLAQKLKKLNGYFEQKNFYLLNQEISYFLGLNYLLLNFNDCKLIEIEELVLIFLKIFWSTYDLKEAEIEILDSSLLRFVEKVSVLNSIDFYWKKHLKKTELLSETIGLRGYGQLDPLQEYKIEAFNLFVETNLEIKYNSIYDILRLQML